MQEQVEGALRLLPSAGFSSRLQAAVISFGLEQEGPLEGRASKDEGIGHLLTHTAKAQNMVCADPWDMVVSVQLQQLFPAGCQVGGNPQLKISKWEFLN